MNRFSAGGYVAVEKFGICPQHKLGAWDSWNVKLMKHGIIQPTIGESGGRFVKGADPISRPEFYRENLCMLNLFLEWTAGRRIKSHRELLNHESLYKLATGLELIDGEPAGVPLSDSKKWLERWRLSGRAINMAGELVWSYDPESRNTKAVGGQLGVC